MVEVHTRGQETPQQVNAAEAARENHQAEQEAQMHRPVMPPFSQEGRTERYATKRKQRIREEPGHAGERHNEGRAKQKAAWTPEDEKLFHVIFDGATEEQINAHNERIKADREKAQQKKEKFHEEMLKQYEKYQACLAAMTPDEREAWEMQQEKDRTRQPLTPDELTQLLYKMHANVQAMRRKRAAWLHERDPRYDPMTGDLLEPDEHPLSPTSEYYFDGSTRPRRFVPGDSPHLDKYKKVEVNADDAEPESDSNERLVQRLLKAGFVEVEPTLADKASFEQTQWYRSLSPYEKMQFLQESMREMTNRGSVNKETGDEKFAKFMELLIDFIIELMIALVAPETMEKKNSTQIT